MRIRILLALLLISGLYACAGKTMVKPAPETKVLLAFHSHTRNYLEECG